MQQQHMVEYMVEKGVQKTHCKGVISSTVRYLQKVLQAGVGFILLYFQRFTRFVCTFLCLTPCFSEI